MLDFSIFMADIFARSAFNPILLPQPNKWWKVYNPAAALDDNDCVYLFPRVTGADARSHIGRARPITDELFTLDTHPVLEPEGIGERYGLEDPRISRIDETYYMTFAAFDGTNVDLHIATAPNIHGPWHRQGPALPDFRFTASGGVRVRWKFGNAVENREPKGGDRRSKSGAIFPSKIDGRFFMIFGEFRIWLATSSDGLHFTALPGPFLGPRKGTKYFDNVFVEMGPPPILYGDRWLILYHGVNEEFRYQVGYLLLDREDPTRILHRSEQPIFSPRESYEVADGPIDVIPGMYEAVQTMSTGQKLADYYETIRRENIMPEVIFCTGAILRAEALRLYYGARDSTVCTAVASIHDVLRRDS